MTLLDNITDINPEDWKLFREFFKTEWHEPNYANAWAYIIQACRGAGGLGKKFYDGETLIGLGKHNGHPVLVRPVGERKPQKVHDVAHRLKEATGKPVYVKHAHKDDVPHLDAFSDMGEFPWHPDEPYDDDTYPQSVVDIDKAIRSATQERGMRQTLARFVREKPEIAWGCSQVRRYEPERYPYQARAVQRLLAKYSEAHENIVRHLAPDGFCFLVEMDAPVGFYVFEPIGSNHAGWYANLTDYGRITGLTEAMTFYMYSDLSRLHGITHVNSGGSERESLHKFKSKFFSEWKTTNHLVLL